MSENKTKTRIPLKDKLILESTRETVESWNTIRLYREGTFFRAFNQSAWLVAEWMYQKEYREKMGDKYGLKVSRSTTGDMTYYMIGFPVQSFEKYIPVHDNTDMGDEDCVVITMNSLTCPSGSLSEIEHQYKQWTDSIPESEPKQKKHKDTSNNPDTPSTYPSHDGLFSIMRDIAMFNIETSTPMETINFLIQLKHRVNTLL